MYVCIYVCVSACVCVYVYVCVREGEKRATFTTSTHICERERYNCELCKVAVEGKKGLFHHSFGKCDS